MMKTAKLTLFYSVAFLILILFGYLFIGVNNRVVSFDEAEVHVEVADDASERRLGLGDYEKLEENEGLLFVFDEPARHGIWMKDVEFPIDVIWLDESKKIIHIVTSMKPSSYPDTTYKPDEDAKYVIELPSGFVNKNNVSAGDNVEFSL